MKTLAIPIIFAFCLSAFTQSIPTPLSGFNSQDLAGTWMVLGLYDLNSELNLNNAYCPHATFTIKENNQVDFSLAINLGYETETQYYNSTFTVNSNDEAVLEASDSELDLVVVGYDGNNLMIVQRDTNIAYVLSQQFRLWSDNVSVILSNIPQRYWYPDFNQHFHGYTQQICHPPYPVLAPTDGLGNYYVAGIYISSFAVEPFQCGSIYFKDMGNHWEIFSGFNKQYLPTDSWDAFKNANYPGLLIGKNAVTGVAYIDSEYAVIVEGYVKGGIIATLLSVEKSVPESAYELFAQVIQAEKIERDDFIIWRIDNSQCGAEAQPEIFM